MGSKSNLSVKQSITIETMISIESSGDGKGNGDSTWKQASSLHVDIFKIRHKNLHQGIC